MSNKSPNSSQSLFTQVGFVQDAHGIRGELYVKIPSRELSWMDQLSSFQLQVRSQKDPAIPMTVERWRPHKEGMVLKAREIPDRNRAEELKGFSFLIPESLLVSAPGETPFLRELLNFEVLDRGKSLGVVTGFMDNGAHDLLQVGEYLIPFVEAFIVDIQYENKKILMDLPQGLME